MASLVHDYDDENSTSSTISHASECSIRIREKREPVSPYALVYFLEDNTYCLEKANLLLPNKEDRVVGKSVNATFKNSFHQAVVLGISKYTAELSEIEKKHQKQIDESSKDTSKLQDKILPDRGTTKGKGPGRPKSSKKGVGAQTAKDANVRSDFAETVQPINIGTHANLPSTSVGGYNERTSQSLAATTFQSTALETMAPSVSQVREAANHKTISGVPAGPSSSTVVQHGENSNTEDAGVALLPLIVKI